MSLLKDPVTLRLDAVAATATETLGLYRDLEAVIDDQGLEALLAEQGSKQAELLQRVDELRRGRGDLPQAGDPERSHLEAAGAYLRAKLLPGETTAHYAESLLHAAAEVSARLDEALHLDLDPALRGLLEELSDTNRELERALRGYLP